MKAVYLCGGGADADDDRGTIDARGWDAKTLHKVAGCPRETEHCYGPTGYSDWHEWAAERSKTHYQRRCDCGLFLLLVPKPARCECGHAKSRHIDGHGLCLVKSCALCLIYRPVSQ